MASLRARIRNQENENVTFHHGKAGRTPGLKAQSGLETPRRALGDVGNTGIFKTPAGKPLVKSAQQNKLKSSTIHRNKAPLSIDTKKDFKRISQKENTHEKEKMIPFVDDEKPLPRSQAVETILRNVSQLYRGCFESSVCTPHYLDNPAKLDLKLETVERPNSITDPFCWWSTEDSKLFESSSEVSLDDMVLPPVDTDLSGLGLP